MSKVVHVIGAGFAGLSSACYLAKNGYHVTVIEQHGQVGGRARSMNLKGFTFDMGPSWYWMPDIFERFFNDFGYHTSDFYELKKLDPGFVIHYADGDLSVPADHLSLFSEVEKMETGAAQKLRDFLDEAEEKYKISMADFIHKPCHSWTEFLDPKLIGLSFKLDLLSSVAKAVRSKFKHPKIRQLLEFPVLFLGQTAEHIPSMYTLMNHAGITQGTYYPMGGIHTVPRAMEQVARALGVEFKLNEEVQEISVVKGRATRIITNKEMHPTNGVVISGDYHHFEQHILPKPYRRYSNKYWQERTLAPSSLLYFVGLRKRLKNIQHHTLFFDTDLNDHAKSIYKHPSWPEDPLFYVCAPSVTDPTVAPDGCENLFFLIPVAPGLDSNQALIDQYFEKIIKRLEKYCGETISSHILVRRNYGVKNFMTDYHAFKGNAYGLANTLTQTAFLKPKIQSLVKNIVFAGQLTVPGPGMPPAIISGKIAAEQLKIHT